MAELSRADRPDDREASPPSFDQGDKPAAFSADPCGGLFAKPDVTLLDHLTAVLELGERLVERHFDQSPLLALRALMACALHDIGKATVDFQAKMCRLRQGIAAGRGQTFPHALAALPFVLAAELLLEESPATALAGDETAQGAAGGALRERRRELPATAAVLAHHSSLHGDLFVGFGLPRYAGGYEEIFRSIWRRLDEAARRLKAHPPIVLPDGERVLALAKELMKDDLSRLLHGFFNASARLIDVLKKNDSKRYAAVMTTLHLADWLASGGVASVEGLYLKAGGAKLERFLNHRSESEGKAFVWRAFQVAAGRAGASGFWLRAPTGTGKTEALLRWAGDANRVIYLLPTQATVNAMWRRLRHIYGDDAVGLAHGRASYMLRKSAFEETLDDRSENVRLLSRVFARPVTVATLDQWLLAHLHGRHWEERRFLSREAAVILDEIHAYEPYMLGLLWAALERERPRRIALASATLPEALMERFQEIVSLDRIVEAEPPLWNRRRHRVELRPGSLVERMDEIVEFARAGQAVLVVANTVEEAQRLYRALKEEVRWPKLHLYHGRFIFRDRERREQAVAHPVPGTIFVATQVVEVSLDISYDVLMTDLAPVDALVQRMGRVNRSGNRAPAPVVIYEDGSAIARGRVYDEEVLALSRSILKNLPPEPTDRDWLDANEEVYRAYLRSHAWQDAFREGRENLEWVQTALGTFTIDLSDAEMLQRFVTRRGSLSVDVIPLRFVDEALRLIEQGDRWRMVEFQVPVRIQWLHAYREAFEHYASLDTLVTQLPYDDELGLLSRSLADEWGIGASSGPLILS
ncbi:MAG: CRISPR-associated helicase Cas3 [Hydrogenibacillus schlegelii]|uniref:CRISPR-associated helicase Cas3 n=1 Tax=Hydrogenibacillus schlegelii TaxID=1484 RepID=A0A2T5G9M0_HYDSH|nr:CRISPR-associated helicase Cas3' [Hydrogenibacillus schlegelii]PTQ52876.1 MAG: CRISPR-associated helicase Cas3 [Hydrogenibacillus schlegelii]